MESTGYKPAAVTKECTYASKYASEVNTEVKLRGAFAGDRYCFPGVGDASNDFAVPTAKFSIQDIVGRYLVPLETTPAGVLAAQRQTSSQGDTNNEKVSVVLSPAPVSCLLDRSGNVRTHGHLGALADDENFVLVHFNHTKDMEACPEIPCINTAEIPTPDTPSPRSTSS